MTVRPDLIDVWIYRVVAGELQILMLHRAPHKVLPGLWQGVSGMIEPGEGATAAAIRELREETAFGGEAVHSMSSLDFVASFLWDDAVMASVHFAAEVSANAEPRLSSEHDDHRWLPADAAIALSVWPAYREAIGRVRDCLIDPERAPWFRLDLD